MIRTEKWDRRYLQLAKYVAENWSRDPRTKVGAVVVNFDERKEFLGYNGFPQGVQDTSERYADRELKNKMVVHAEVNAILKAGSYAKGATLYIYPSFVPPTACNECAKIIIQSGIKELVVYAPDPDDSRFALWADSIRVSQQMFMEAGVTWSILDETNGTT